MVAITESFAVIFVGVRKTYENFVATTRMFRPKLKNVLITILISSDSSFLKVYLFCSQTLTK